MTNYAPVLPYNQSMEIIYIDQHFLINLFTDYLLCLASARVCGIRLKRLRYLSAAFIGAAYSVLIIALDAPLLSGPAGKLACALLMSCTAFGSEERPLRCAGVFLGVSAAFGGAVWAVSLAGTDSSGLSVKNLFLSFALCYCVISLFFRCRAKLPDRKTVGIRAEFLGRSAQFTGLLDTGNSLSDPISGSPVMIASPHALRDIFMDDTALLSLDATELIELSRQLPQLSGRFRLVSYSAVGSKGLLAAFRPEQLYINGQKNTEYIIAVSPAAAGDGFDAIV